MAQERLNVILQMITSNFKSEARGVSGSLNRMRGDFQNTDKSARMLEQGFSRVGKMAGVAIAGAAVGAVALFTREMVQSVRAFADFDQKMTQSLAIMGNVSEAMRGDMSDAAREVGRTTLFSADQAAESYFFLASAGLSAAASIEAMPQVAQFAQAGMFDMARATDLLTDAQSALGLKSQSAQQNLQNMARVSDVLVKANILANASVEQFSESLTNKAGAALRSVGKDIEEGVAVLAAFADQGVKGEEAGTQFAIVLRDLQTKALQNKDAFEQAGVAVFDAAGEMRNIADIIGDLEGALVGMSDAEKKTTLLGLGFSDKSVSAITALLGTSDAIRTYEASLRSASGTTQEVADKQLESLAGQFELVKSKIEDTRIEVGEEMAPALRDLIPQIEGAVDALGEFAVAAGPNVASGISGMIGLLEGAQEAFFDFRNIYETALTELTTLPGTRFNLLGDMDIANAARQQAELMELLAGIRRAGGPQNLGGTTTQGLTRSLIFLEQEAALTQDSMEALGRTFEATEEEILAAAEATRDWIKANKEDVPTDELERWILELEAGIMAAEEMERFRSRWPGIFGDAGSAAGEATPPVDEFGDALGETADEAEDLATALERALAAQTSLADQILRFTSPVFNAVSAVDALREAHEKREEVEGDSEATARDLAEAELDVTRKTLEAKSAMDALGEGSDAVDALALAFDGPRSRLLEILETLGLIEEGDWATIIDLELRLQTQQAREAWDQFNLDTFGTRVPVEIPRGLSRGLEPSRHQGGSVEAGKRYPVLRNEIFVPSTDGTVMAAAGAGDVYNIQVTVPLKDMNDFARESAREIESVLLRRNRGAA